MTCGVVSVSAELLKIRLVSSYLVHARILHTDQFWVEQDLRSPISLATKLMVGEFDSATLRLLEDGSSIDSPV
jgi:hypothetical protein